MGTDDYAAAYMAAEDAYNAGDWGPMRDLMADDFQTSSGLGKEEFLAGLQAGIRTFTSAGLNAYGPFLLDYGAGVGKDGSTYRAAGIMRFDEAGQIVAFTSLADR